MPINKVQLRELIEETLHEIDAYSESAVNLLMGTAAQESHLGTYIKQIRGPALGIFQMEQATHHDIRNRLDFRAESLMLQSCKSPGLAASKAMTYNLKYAIAMCRYKYLLIPERLPEPNDIMGMARYWKKYYNTHLGKGTEKEFIENYRRYVL